ncbi:MAG: type III-B CRISPR module RAMP protein Cmr1 [Promethearchaeota archaeon]
MNSVEIYVRTISPLFIAGADQKFIYNEGLRPPTLKGLMRWWFRTLLANYSSLDEIKFKEEEIFGSTSKKSRFVIRTEILKGKIVRFNVPSKLSYLLFSIKMLQKRRIRNFCYHLNTEFKIHLSSDYEEALNIAIICLWALIYLGGVGSRSRRGMGQLEIIKFKSDIKIPFNIISKSNNLEEYIYYMGVTLKKIHKYFNDFFSSNVNGTTDSIPSLFGGNSKIFILEKPYDDYISALTDINNVYRNFRKALGKDSRYLLGLPITTYNNFSGLRLSSPFTIGLTRIAGKYYLRILKFYNSIHKDFDNNLDSLRNILDDLNEEINEKIGSEIEINLPG